MPIMGTPRVWGWCAHSIGPQPIQPRVCGDTSFRTASSVAAMDTTPRMRGYLPNRRPRHAPQRYNPAYAGILHQAPAHARVAAIQPRVCGDTLGGITARHVSPDTTPRMRGYCRPGARCRAAIRYNPAYAGILSSSSKPRTPEPIQPRVCGDTSRECLTPGPF